MTILTICNNHLTIPDFRKLLSKQKKTTIKLASVFSFVLNKGVILYQSNYNNGVLAESSTDR